MTVKRDENAEQMQILNSLRDLSFNIHHHLYNFVTGKERTAANRSKINEIIEDIRENLNNFKL